MKILVTGGAGFVGTNLIKQLLKEGHTVTSLDDYSTGSESNHIEGCEYIKSHIEQIHYVTDKFDVIYHLAGLSRIQPSFENPTETFNVNTVGTQRVCEFARSMNAKLIYAGSSSKHHNPYQSPYATCKYLGEEICRMYALTFGMDVQIARFYNVYGPNEIVDGDWAAVIGIWRRQVRDGEPLTIIGDGEQRRDFTHVVDIVDGLIKIMNYGKTNEVIPWELGCGRNYSINEVADMFIQRTNSEKVYLPDQAGNYRVTIREEDDALILLGWDPKDRLEDYIKSLYPKQLELF